MFDSILLVFFVASFVVMVGAGWKITRLAEEVDVVSAERNYLGHHVEALKGALKASKADVEASRKALEASLSSELREATAYNFLLSKFGDVRDVIDGHAVLDSTKVNALGRILWDVSIHAETCEEDPDFLL